MDPEFIMIIAFVSGSSVHEPPSAPEYETGLALSLQNILCSLSKELTVWPTVIETPGGSTMKNLRVAPPLLPHPAKALLVPIVVDETGLLIRARSVVAPKLGAIVGAVVGVVGAAVVGITVGLHVWPTLVGFAVGLRLSQ